MKLFFHLGFRSGCVQMSSSGNLYGVLGVSPTATKREIRLKFLKLSLIYHPDKQRGNKDASLNAEKYIEIVDAYKILHDDSARRVYDWQQRPSIRQQSPKSSTSYPMPQRDSKFESYYQQARAQRPTGSPKTPHPSKGTDYGAFSEQYTDNLYKYSEATRSTFRYAENRIHQHKEDFSNYKTERRAARLRRWAMLTFALSGFYFASILTGTSILPGS